jgi:CrcB protein
MAASVAPRKVSGGLSHGLTPRTKLLLGVGFCGSFTTFSTYSVDIANMIHNGQTAKAFGYVATNNVGGIAAAAVGMMFAKKVFGKL